MEQKYKENRATRILSLWQKLCQGDCIRKKQEAEKFGVDNKTIQRDIEELKIFASVFYRSEVLYDRIKKGYVLETNSSVWFTKEEILVMAKVLLESRAFSKAHISNLIYKTVGFCAPEKRKYIEDILQNEMYHYIPAKHEENIFQKLWDISYAIREQRKIEIEYYKGIASEIVQRRIEPQGVLFSEFYFYILGYIEGKEYEFPTIYRLDRIQSHKILEEHFHIPYNKRFQEGEFRKKVQFMTGGKLMRIQFRYWGNSLEAILDRLPTARVLKEDETGALIEAEVFGKGVKMWLLSQAQYIEVLKPLAFREEMKETLKEMLQLYEDQEQEKVI